jgi:hypothetical protein
MTLITAKAFNSPKIGESELMQNKKLAIPKPKKHNWEKQAWKAFSEYIRAREGYCEFHAWFEAKHIDPPCKCAGVLQTCHKISRSKRSILYDERNVFCACSGSNTWAHFNEAEWSELWKKMYPEDVEYLESRKNIITRMNAWTFKILCDEYKQKLAELK